MSESEPKQTLSWWELLTILGLLPVSPLGEHARKRVVREGYRRRTWLCACGAEAEQVDEYHEFRGRQICERKMGPWSREPSEVCGWQESRAESARDMDAYVRSPAFRASLDRPSIVYPPWRRALILWALENNEPMSPPP